MTRTREQHDATRTRGRKVRFWRRKKKKIKCTQTRVDSNNYYYRRTKEKTSWIRHTRKVWFELTRMKHASLCGCSRDCAAIPSCSVPCVRPLVITIIIVVIYRVADCERNAGYVCRARRAEDANALIL